MRSVSIPRGAVKRRFFQSRHQLQIVFQFQEVQLKALPFPAFERFEFVSIPRGAVKRPKFRANNVFKL